MRLAALTVDDMISGFSNPVLPLVTAESTFEDSMNMQKLLNDNLSQSLHSQVKDACRVFRSVF
jgi:hypothetical protein